MRSIRNYAIAASTHNSMQRELVGYALGKDDLWRHSLACAIAAQMLAEIVHYPEVEEAFVAGLLHDIGKVSLNETIQRLSPVLRNVMETRDLAFSEAERLVLGYDHADVGGRIAQKWYLPQRLAQAIAQHHEPVQNGQVAPLAALAHLANAVCLLAGIGIGADGLHARLSTQAMHTLQLTESQVETVLARLVDEFQRLQTLFSPLRAAHLNGESNPGRGGLMATANLFP